MAAMLARVAPTAVRLVAAAPKAAVARTSLLASEFRPIQRAPAVAGAPRPTRPAGDLRVRRAHPTTRAASAVYGDLISLAGGPQESSPPRGLAASGAASPPYGCGEVPHPFSRCGSAVGRRWHAASCACGCGRGAAGPKVMSRPGRGTGAAVCANGYAPIGLAGSLQMTPEFWRKISGEVKADYNPCL